MDWKKHIPAIDLFWHLLFLDCFLMIWSYGGVSVHSRFLHGCFLLVATGALALSGRVRPQPKLFVWLSAIVLIVAALQLIPLPESIFPYLAPVKHRLIEAVAAIYPEIEYTTQITTVPAIHQLKLAGLVMDIYLVGLLLAAEPPGKPVLPLWLTLIGATTAILAIAAGAGMIDEHSWFSPWSQTLGGLINQNHFATVTIFLLLPLAYFAFCTVRDRRIALALLFGLVCLLLLWGFRYAYSRSGTFNLVLGLSILSGLFAFDTWRQRRFQARLLLLPLLLAAVLVPLVLTGKGTAKISDQGVSLADRIAYARIGFNYLAEMPVLGTGLGSMEVLLDPVEKRPIHQTRTLRHLHNEYLQNLLELGLPGFVCLVGFLFLALAPLRFTWQESDPVARGLLFVTWAIAGVALAHSLIAFPLRILSPRLLILLLVFAFTAPYRTTSTQRVPRIWLLPMVFLLAVLGFLGRYLARIPTGDDVDKDAVWSLTYAMPYRVPYLVASRQLEELMWGEVPFDEARRQLAEIRPMLHASFRDWPFNLKALNSLFMAQALALKMDQPEFSPETFTLLRDKAEQIRALGQDANVNARIALFFLLAMEQDHLNEEDLALFRAWRRDRLHDFTRPYTPLSPGDMPKKR